jgi:hypothetical protein
MIEGKWLKDDRKKDKKKEILKERDPRDLVTRLITYEEEREWLEKEKTNKNRRSDRDVDPDNDGSAQR